MTLSSYTSFATGDPMGPTHFNSKLDKIVAAVDTVSAYWTNVQDYGATGDGTTDDTAAIQAAINATNLAGGGTVFFPAGTYYVSSLNYYAGITFLGVGAASKFKKIPSTDKFSRVFTQTAIPDYTTDSAVIAWRNLAFDGNSSNASAYSAFQLEQQHMIFLVGGNNGVGRLRAIIDGCTFENCVADAVSVYHNVNLEISNCMMRECFRGGLVITGGYSIVKATNLDMGGDTDLSRFDLEVDGAGYLGSYATSLQVTNVRSQNGFDVSFGPATGSRLQMTNCASERGNTTLVGSDTSADNTLSFVGCQFALGVADTFVNRIVYPNRMLFSNCEFTYVRAASVVGTQTFGLFIYWIGTIAGEQVTFDGCVFRVDSSVNGSDTVYGVRPLPSDIANRNRCIVRACRFLPGFDIGVYARGNDNEVADTYIDAVMPIRMEAFSGGWMGVDSVRIGPTATNWMYIESNSTMTFTHENILVDEAQSGISTGFGFLSNTYKGRRVILAASAPTTASVGLVNDVWRRTVPSAASTYEWVCRGASGSSYSWEPMGTLTAATLAGSVTSGFVPVSTDTNTLGNTTFRIAAGVGSGLSALALGGSSVSTAASIGVLRLPNDTYVYARNSGNTGDIPLFALSSVDNLVFGTFVKNVVVTGATIILTANNEVQARVSSRLFRPESSNSVDLGSAQSAWLNFFIGGGFTSGQTLKTANHSLVSRDYTVSFESSSTLTATLPNPSTITGQLFNLKSLGTGQVIVTATSGASIDNLSVYTLASQFSTLRVQSVGTRYIIL